VSQAELDQLTAPIALYSATYPLAMDTNLECTEQLGDAFLAQAGGGHGLDPTPAARAWHIRARSQVLFQRVGGAAARSWDPVAICVVNSVGLP